MKPSTDRSPLSQQALVLNRSWAAVSTTTVRHALGLVYTGAAKAIRPETYEVYGFDTWVTLEPGPGEPCVRAVACRIRVPEVIVLTRFNGVPRQSVTLSRRNLFRRDRHTCQYCGRRPSSHSLSIDHVVPRSRGGRTSWENCVVACVRCNSRKADRLPHEVGLLLNRPPTRPVWTPIVDLPVGRLRDSWARFVGEGSLRAAAGE